MDIQLTDFENSALTIAVGMIANVVNTFDTDFILPVSLVDENMKRAHNRDGLLQTKFWWKMPAPGQSQPVDFADTDFLGSSSSSGENVEMTADASVEEMQAKDSARYQELYIWQILNGDESIGFDQGLLRLCDQFMALKQWPQDKADQIRMYLRFLADRATGKVPTGAHFIRNFVMGHPDYKRDSKLTQQMNFDLMKMMATLNDTNGEARRGLLGEYA